MTDLTSDRQRYEREISEISIETINRPRMGSRLESLMYARLFAGIVIPCTVTGSNTSINQQDTAIGFDLLELYAQKSTIPERKLLREELACFEDRHGIRNLIVG